MLWQIIPRDIVASVPKHTAMRVVDRLRLAQSSAISPEITGTTDTIRMAACICGYYHPPMNVLTVKLPADLHATLMSEARRRNMTRSSLVREIIEDALIRDAAVASPSCAALAGDLVGAVRSGRSDLATNRRLLDEAIEQDAHRGAADRRR